MIIEQLVTELLALATETELRQWLEAHRQTLGLELIETLQDEMEECKLKDPQRAMEMAGVALQAASFLSEPQAMALALWMKGTASMYTGDFPACAESYQKAESIYAAAGDNLTMARLQSYRVFALANLAQHREALTLAKTARRGLVTAGYGDSIHMAKLEMNLGVACRQAGRHNEALSAYERGRAIFEKLGDTVQVGRMDINRAKVLEKLDRFEEATTLLESARAALLSQGVALTVARADLNLGHLAFRRGRYRQALELHARARDGFERLDTELEVAIVDFFRAPVYLALNLFAEAQELAAKARQAFIEQEMARYATLATVWQAAAARGLGDVKKALTLFEQARSDLEKRGEAVEVAFLDLQRIALLRQTAQLQEALTTARSTTKTLTRYGMSIRLAQARLLLADCLLDMDQAEEATPLYTTALEVVERQELAALIYRARYGLGRVAETNDDNEAAAHHYQAAIFQLEAIHHDLRVDEFQAGFMDDKLDVYEAAVRLALRQGDITGAFDYVERAKAGALLDLLARGLKLELPDNEDEELLGRLQALREAWHWQVNQLEGLSPDEPESPTRSGEAVRRDAIRQIERQLSETWRQLRLQQHRYVALTGEKRLSLANVQAQLPGDTLLIEYYAVEGDLLAFLVGKQGLEVVHLDIPIEAVEELILTWRFDLDSLRLLLPDIEPAEIAGMETDGQLYLQKLYQILMAPLARQLASHSRLIIVPHQALHYLPLAALYDGQSYLVDRFEISYLPAASLLPQTWRVFKNPPGLKRPDFSETPPLILAHSGKGSLPHTIVEAQQVADVFDNAQLFIEETATVNQLQTHGPGCGLLHLATHGTFRADNPFFSWLRLADTRLTVHDVYNLSLPQTTLVTLSACETGLGDLRGGNVLGLSHSFLAAGARSLLLSLWAVDDASTAQLMAAFYRGLAAGQAKTEALGQAQQQVRERYRHPFYWAGFVLVGNNDDG